MVQLALGGGWLYVVLDIDHSGHIYDQERRPGVASGEARTLQNQEAITIVNSKL